MSQELIMNANPLVAFLKKPATQFTKADIISYIQENEITMVNFMYPAGDGRLKTLNFVINNLEYLETILTCGERVDGSSLFSFIEAGSSDLYVVPRFRTAFVDPFANEPTLSMLCSFFNKDGQPLESSPEYTLHKACKAFTEVTGMEFQAMGELEYYVIAPDAGLFPAVDQKGYHESGPYAKFNAFRKECMTYIAKAGGMIKYGHSEVGNFTLEGNIYEQNEIEFLPINAEQAAEQLMIAKWIIRNLGYEYGYGRRYVDSGYQGRSPHSFHRVLERLRWRSDDSVSQRLRRGHQDRDPDHSHEGGPLHAEGPHLPGCHQGGHRGSRSVLADPLQPGDHRRYRKVCRRRPRDRDRDPRDLIFPQASERPSHPRASFFCEKDCAFSENVV